MKRFILAALLALSASPLGAMSASVTNQMVGTTRVLGSLKSANMNSTADQAIALGALQGTPYRISSILVTNCTGTLTIAAGGFYTATSKSGTTIVAAGQAYSALTSAAGLMSATIASAQTFTGSSIYLSLTTAAGSAATCDVYVMGHEVI